MTTPYGKGLSLLIVDDEPVIRDVVRLVVRQDGFEIEEAANVAEAKKLLSVRTYDVALVDKNLPDGTGIDVVRFSRSPAARSSELGPDGETTFLLMTGFATLQSAVEALQLDVADYLLKPFDDVDALRARVRIAVTTLLLRRENRSLLSELKEKNKVLEGLVVRDALTGLFNHAHLQDAIDRELRRCQRSGNSVSLLVLDLDGLAKVNDERGHHAGDRVLKRVGELLSSGGGVMHPPRGPDLIARMGGDEFAVLLPETPRAGAAVRAEEIRAAIARSDLGATITASIGAAAYPADAPDRPQLLARCGEALLAAKHSGRNQIVSWSPALARLAPEKSEAVAKSFSRFVALDRSIEARSFLAVYQPIVDAKTTVIAAYEALTRPTDPGFASPLELFSTAQDAGRVAPLGRILRELAVAPFAQLGEPMRMFLNVHPMELGDSLLDPRLEEWVPKLAKRVVLEITESAEYHRFDRLKQTVARLRDLGFLVALDDLGAGYAGLNALAALNPDYVKLDMALVRGVQSDSRAARLVRYILDFADGEGMRVVGEGIENAAEAGVVRDLGCHLLQGYYFARPAPPFCGVTPR